jgi:multidrug efflux pump subunit AcrA (membrane-fusion protein)
MKKSITFFLPAGIIAAGLLLMFWFMSMRDQPEPREAKQTVRTVSTVVIADGQTMPRVSALGRVLSSSPVDLAVEVAGMVEAGDIQFKPASAFKKGNLLLKIDDRQASLDLQSAKADLMSALASVLPEIKIDFPDKYDDWQNFFDNISFDGAVADLPETEHSRVRLYLSRFNVYKLYFAVKNLEIRLEKHYKRAPFDGTIVTTLVRPGSSVGVNAKLGQIIATSDLEVELSCVAADLPWIRRNADVLLTSREIDGEWRGRVTRIGQSIDSRSETVPVYVALSSGPIDRLYEGAFVEAELASRPVDGYEIPRSAIYDNRFVYLIKDGALYQQPVGINRLQSETAIIGDGLHPGDSLVIELMQGVAPGMAAVARDDRADAGSDQ